MNKLTLIFTVLFGLAIGSSHPARAQSYNTTATSTEGGASSKLFAASDKRRFDKIVNSGFQITYEIRGKTITASAVGNKFSRVRSRKVKLNRRSVMVKAVTTDKALEITTYYTFDEKKRKVIIDRQIQNTSGETVKVKMIGEYVNPNLVFGAQRDAKSDSGETVVKLIRAGQLVPTGPVALKLPRWLKGSVTDVCECQNPPDPCGLIRCPEGPSYYRARLDLSTPNRMMVYFNEPTSLASERAGVGTPTQTRSIIEMNYGPVREKF